MLMLHKLYSSNSNKPMKMLRIFVTNSWCKNKRKLQMSSSSQPSELPDMEWSSTKFSKIPVIPTLITLYWNKLKKKLLSISQKLMRQSIPLQEGPDYTSFNSNLGLNKDQYILLKETSLNSFMWNLSVMIKWSQFLFLSSMIWS